MKKKVVTGFVEFTGKNLPPSPLTNLPQHRTATASHPILTVADDGIFTEGTGGFWWLPPVRHAQTKMIMPNIMGSFAGFRVVAQNLAARIGGPRLRPLALHEPVAFLAWVSRDRLHLLLGNTESGHIGDSRHPRPVQVIGLEPETRYRDQDARSKHVANEKGK